MIPKTPTKNKKLTSDQRRLVLYSVLISCSVTAVIMFFGLFFVVGMYNSSRSQISQVAGSQTLTRAQTEARLNDLVQDESATISVVESLSPSVVSVIAKKARKDVGLDGLLWSGDIPPEDPIERAAWNNELVDISGGTGFFVREDGLIVTNRHVVQDEEASFFVVTYDGATLPATVLARDPILDIAVIDVEGDNFLPVQLGSSENLRIGQTVIAIGNSLSEFQNTVTKGVISGLDRQVVASDSVGSNELIEHAIQTDAAINPGNSGGPLINLLGQVIGMNTATSFEGQSISFAIPINDVSSAVKDVKEYGRILHPWIGVRYTLITKDIQKYHDLLFDSGAYLQGENIGSAIVPNSPAELAGLQTGDVILEVDGVKVDLEHTLGQVISSYRPGDMVELRIGRGEEVFYLSVTLGEYPSS